MSLFTKTKFDKIIHCAAQPSHDKAGEIPLVDFEVNAVGTLNLLEATRLTNREAVFIHMSTNKVYGDAPNRLPLTERSTRYDFASAEHFNGIDETLSIDQCLHSVFGASKTAADVLAQEYGRYYGMNVGIFRGGCLTGPSHSGVELHGYLSYLIHVAVYELPYVIFGYKGKQVRDQIHSIDVIRAFEEFSKNPRQGEVYNLGGGRENSISILETFELLNELNVSPVTWTYVDKNRVGDHICYISNMKKFMSHYPGWQITRSLRDIVTEMVDAQRKSKANA